MSLFRERWKGPTNGEYPVDRAIFTKTASAAVDEVKALVEELTSKKGVPVAKLTNAGRVVTKTLHVDPSTGLFLSYSPSPKHILYASAPLSQISEFRPGADQQGFHKITIMPERIPYCFSLVFKDGRAWNLSFTTGNQTLWKNAIEILVRRAIYLEQEYPLRAALNRFWVNLAGTSKPARQFKSRADGGGLVRNPNAVGNDGSSSAAIAMDQRDRSNTITASEDEIDPGCTFAELDSFLTQISGSVEHSNALVAFYGRGKHARQQAQQGAAARAAIAQKTNQSQDPQTTINNTQVAATAAQKAESETEQAHKQLAETASRNDRKPFPVVAQFLMECVFHYPILLEIFDRYAETEYTPPTLMSRLRTFVDPWITAVRQTSIPNTNAAQSTSTTNTTDSGSKPAVMTSTQRTGQMQPVCVSAQYITTSGFLKFLAEFQFEDWSPEEVDELMLKYKLWDPEEESRGYLQRMQRKGGPHQRHTPTDPSTPNIPFGTRGEGDHTMDDDGFPKISRVEVGMNFTQFCSFLFDPRANSWFKPKHNSVYQDMHQPLCHYYISSSHNTYLTGDQLGSESSIDMYRLCMLRGCRCVELDCWDGDDGFPVIYHGHTRTTKITFESVIRALDETAFVMSPYPIILSLEIHTNPDQQHIMAVMMAEIFGPKLLVLDDFDIEHVSLDPSHSERGGLTFGQSMRSDLFTPETLKYKVLVKGKRNINTSPVHRGKSIHNNASSGGSDSDNSDNSDNSDSITTPAASGGKGGRARSRSVNQRPRSKSATREGEDGEGPEEGNEEEDEESGSDSEHESDDQQRLSLADVVTVPAHRTESVAASVKIAKPNMCTSFGEQRMLRLVERESKDMIAFTKRMFARVYPKASRINSSNYNPQPSWNCGAQLVALNFQTMDEHLKLNEAKFEQNGKCGYILKPPHLRAGVGENSKGPKFNTDEIDRANQGGGKKSKSKGSKNQLLNPWVGTKLKYPMSGRWVLSVRVIAGRLLPRPGMNEKGERVSPLVRLSMEGCPEDVSDPSKTNVDSSLQEDGVGHSGARQGARTAADDDNGGGNGADHDPTSERTRKIHRDFDALVDTNGVYSTTHVDYNGANPQWCQEFHFSIQCIDLAVLSLRVLHKSPGKSEQDVAVAMIPITSLRLGYRAVPLRSPDCFTPISFSSLLCHFSIFNVTPTQYREQPVNQPKVQQQQTKPASPPRRSRK